MSPLLIPVLIVISAMAKAACALSPADESGDGMCSACHRSPLRAVSFIQSGFATHTQWKLKQQVVAPPELGNAHLLASANESSMRPSQFVDVAAAAVVEPTPNASLGGQSETDSISQAYDESNGEANASRMVAGNSTLLLARSSPASDESSRPTSNESSAPASHVSSKAASDESSSPASHVSSRPASNVSSRPASNVSSRPTSDVSSRPASEQSSLWEKLKRAIWGPGAAVGKGDRLREEKRLAIKAEDFDLAKKLKGDIETLHEGHKLASDKHDGKREKGHPSDLYLAIVLFGMFFLKMMAWV